MKCCFSCRPASLYPVTCNQIYSRTVVILKILIYSDKVFEFDVSNFCSYIFKIAIPYFFTSLNHSLSLLNVPRLDQMFSQNDFTSSAGGAFSTSILPSFLNPLYTLFGLEWNNEFILYLSANHFLIFENFTLY